MVKFYKYLKNLLIPCFSKLSSRSMQTRARYLLTSRKYSIVPLFSFIVERVFSSKAASSLWLNKKKKGITQNLVHVLNRRECIKMNGAESLCHMK